MGYVILLIVLFAVGFVIGYLAPLGDPETGAGHSDPRHACRQCEHLVLPGDNYCGECGVSDP